MYLRMGLVVLLDALEAMTALPDFRACGIRGTILSMQMASSLNDDVFQTPRYCDEMR
jgi:hypothetical protein